MQHQAHQSPPGRHGTWRNFTPADGLASLRVEHMAQDAAGYLWFATISTGVSRFDGDEFVTFNERDGLCNNGIMCVAADRRGRVWFGARGGLSCRDGDRFHTVAMPAGDGDFLINSLFVDRDDRVWLSGRHLRGGNPGIIGRVDGDTFVDLSAEFARDCACVRGHCWGITQDDDGHIWFARSRLLRYDGARFQVYGPEHGLPDSPLHTLTQPPGGEPMWVGGMGTLGRFDGHSYEPAGIVIDGQVRRIQQDHHGRVWVCTPRNGVLCFSDGVCQSYHPADGLPDPFVTAVQVDREDHIWFASWGGGVGRYDPCAIEKIDAGAGLPSAAVTTIAAADGGRIWAGFGSIEGLTSRSVACWDGDVMHIWGQSEGLVTEDCMVMQAHRSGVLYLGDWQGLVRTDGHTFQRLGPEQGFHGIRVYSLAEDEEGVLYIGHGDARQMHLTAYDGTSFTHRLTLDRDGNTYISSILVRRNGELWFGIGGLGDQFSDRGVGRCRDDGQVDYYSVAEGLPDSRIEDLCEDRHGHVWIATVGGLSRFDGTQLRTFTTEHGLPHNHVLCLYEDGQGHLWIGTQAGVTRYDGDVFQTIHSAHVGATNRITQGADGRLWFALLDGIVGYQPQRVPPRIRMVRVDADRVDSGRLDRDVVTSARRVTFEFKGLSSRTHPGDMLYRWRLRGFDENWCPAIRALRADYQDLPDGEYSFEVKAIDRDLNVSELARIRVQVIPDARTQGLAEALSAAAPGNDFIGNSPALRRVQAQLSQVAGTRETVLILGETGTGKGVAARAVHSLSPGKDGPFIQINCGAIPRDLVESELFGHERGAFTGAVTRKLGKIELAQGGTLFLDEIGDMPLEAQVKLLQLLEERTFTRVGGGQSLPARVRIVAATNRDLRQMAAEGKFREDLYFRLRVFEVQLPALRERQQDIPLLAIYFAERMAAHLNKPLRGVSPAAERVLTAYGWPGNVRELEHAVKRAVIVCTDDEIGAEDLALDLGAHVPAATEQWLDLEEYERRYIRQVLLHTEGRIRGNGGAAAVLGLHPSTLYSRMKKLGIELS